MAGSLTIGTLSDGTNSTSATNCIQGSAKAWVNFNGTGTVAIRTSYNVSSITDNGTGDYTVNFTTALADANYSLAGSAQDANGMSVQYSDVGSPAAGSCRIEVRLGSAANVDCAIVNANFFR